MNRSHKPHLNLYSSLRRRRNSLHGFRAYVPALSNVSRLMILPRFQLRLTHSTTGHIAFLFDVSYFSVPGMCLSTDECVLPLGKLAASCYRRPEIVYSPEQASQDPVSAGVMLVS